MQDVHGLISLTCDFQKPGESRGISDLKYVHSTVICMILQPSQS